MNDIMRMAVLVLAMLAAAACTGSNPQGMQKLDDIANGVEIGSPSDELPTSMQSYKSQKWGVGFKYQSSLAVDDRGDSIRFSSGDGEVLVTMQSTLSETTDEKNCRIVGSTLSKDINILVCTTSTFTAATAQVVVEYVSPYKIMVAPVSQVTDQAPGSSGSSTTGDGAPPSTGSGTQPGAPSINCTTGNCGTMGSTE